MNWQAISFDWNHVRAFLATVEEGSFSGAARALKSTQPTIGRQVAGLEESLGITLFERTVKGPVLTNTGQEFVEHVRTMGHAATQMSLVASGKSQTVTGCVAITTSDLMAATILPKILLELHSIAPGIRVEVVASSNIKNLGQREADIAIRHIRPDQPDLIARHIADLRANYYAASRYFDKVGRPESAKSLSEHQFVGSSDVDQLIAILRERGIATKAENFVAWSESGTAMWEMTKAGLGIALLPEVLGDAEPELEKAIDDFPSLKFPVWLVTHRELRTSARIRVVYDTLTKGLERIAANESGV